MSHASKALIRLAERPAEGSFSHPRTRNPRSVCGGETKDPEVADFPRLGLRMIRRPGDVEVLPIEAGRSPFGEGDG